MCVCVSYEHSDYITSLSISTTSYISFGFLVNDAARKNPNICSMCFYGKSNYGLLFDARGAVPQFMADVVKKFGIYSKEFVSDNATIIIKKSLKICHDHIYGQQCYLIKLFSLSLVSTWLIVSISYCIRSGKKIHSH